MALASSLKSKRGNANSRKRTAADIIVVARAGLGGEVFLMPIRAAWRLKCISDIVLCAHRGSVGCKEHTEERRCSMHHDRSEKGAAILEHDRKRKTHDSPQLLLCRARRSLLVNCAWQTFEKTIKSDQELVGP